ncbi:SubName: Full=Related to large-conductance mechanosensitive channel {ECO:0000313/EMBL:CCA68403.1} [Serendipita indica DSM 11827]|uniref:Related to large-conductance mechanosensitive channel n=1 Tax=Serendipita indica (strain DSM 11827) TaxID=1109443 RepID=G4TAR0_SERID|nr:SubName: Full=Related to large-conductance mechanosensitive channel {ECO:0000313/EMBL:CCA68403.1} [Serendipita indica DSM 11827]CCA68403.1 related to large-conductance mechanosensitive channel [Serendipita indica DSM 11827]
MSTSWDNARHSWEEGAKRVKGAWQGFKEFLLRESVLEVAVGLIIASAFTRIVNSMVTDMILPFIALLPIFNRNLPQQFITLRKGPHQPQGGYNTIQQAEADGAIYLAYGRFIDAVLNFVAIGFVLYLIARFYGYVSGDSIIKHSTKCNYCRKEISEKASRCAFCSSWLDGREDRETSALAPATQ